MPYRLKTISNLVDVWSFYALSAIAFLGELKEVVFIISTAVVIGYTVWKWRRDARVEKDRVFDRDEAKRNKDKLGK